MLEDFAGAVGGTVIHDDAPEFNFALIEGRSRT
jgi:hypothetical protein